MQTITKLASNNNKENRTRSILVILTIVMTTILLTLIGTLGYGLVMGNRTNAGVLYGDYYGSFRGVTEERIKTIKLRGEFTDIGQEAVIGVVEGENNLSLYYDDETALSMRNIKSQLASGSFPQAENEIAAQSAYFKMLGIENPQVGDTVTLSYRANLSTPYAPETFVISGLLSDPTDEDQVSRTAYVSKAYYESIVEAEARAYVVYFKLNEAININADNGEAVIKELAGKCGIEERYASDNGMYLSWALDPGTETLIVCVVIISLVVLFSVLVIYNIFQVGIVRKIQEYGKIKALGATKKQMRHLILAEGMQLAVFAVPLGLLIGLVLAAPIFTMLMGLGDRPSGMVQVSIYSVAIIALVCVIAFLTVWLALRRPMRLVAKISPVEAIRYQESSSKKKKNQGIRQGRRTMGTYELTMANLTGNKKRTLTTILTMGLSCVLFVVMANFVGNMDPEYDAKQYIGYGQFMLALDYSLHDTAYPENNLDQILLNNPLSEELLTSLEEIEGVKDVKQGQVLLLETERGYQTVCVLDRQMFEQELKNGNVVGEFDYDMASAQQALIYGFSYWMADDNVQIGENRSVSLSNGTVETSLTAPVIGSFGSADGTWVITKDTYQALGYDGSSRHQIWIDCEKGMENQVRAALKEQISSLDHLEMSSYQDILERSKMAVSVLKGGLYALTLVIAVISFLNMANTLITSVITRKQEFGVLQAIGMTNAQLNQSLQLEGLLITIGTVVVSLMAGIPLGILLFHWAKNNGVIGIHVYHFPILETAVMILLFAALQITLSFVLTRNIKKESLIERMRYQG